MTTETIERKIIKRLPTAWPLKGMIRADIGEYIVLAHPDRQPHFSTDGQNWTEADLMVPAHNRIVAQFERQRWSK